MGSLPSPFPPKEPKKPRSPRAGLLHFCPHRLFLNEICEQTLVRSARMEKPRTGGQVTGLLRFLWGTGREDRHHNFNPL